MKLSITTAIMVITCLLVVNSQASASSAKSVASLLQQQMNYQRGDKSSTELAPDSYKMLLESEPSEVLPELLPYESDSNKRVRESAYAIAWRVGVSGKDKGIRSEAIRQLCVALDDKDLWAAASSYLLNFAPEDFDEAAKLRIRSMAAKTGREGKYALLVGASGQVDCIPQLRSLRTKLTEMKRSDSWYVRMALARLGSKEDIAYVIEKASSYPRSVGRVTVMVHHVAYIRQPEAILPLRSILDSDERLPSAIMDELPGANYWQYAMWVLAYTIEGFPVKPENSIDFKEEEMKVARQWMREQNIITFKKSTGSYLPDLRMLYGLQ